MMNDVFSHHGLRTALALLIWVGTPLQVHAGADAAFPPVQLAEAAGGKACSTAGAFNCTAGGVIERCFQGQWVASPNRCNASATQAPAPQATSADGAAQPWQVPANQTMSAPGPKSAACKEHRFEWSETPNVQYFDAPSVDELDRIARARMGASFNSVADDCMTVAEHRSAMKRLNLERMKSGGAATKSSAAAPAGTGRAPGQPTSSTWLNGVLAGAHQGPCADTANACLARCGGGMPASSGAALAMASCKKDCEQARQQCALAAAGDGSAGSTPPAASPADATPDAVIQTGREAADRVLGR